jgi:GH24 family phage-related lysozyme (muramidase)
MGFDLGQKSFNEVKDLMGIDFARKYRPLIGLKGEEAQRYLDKNPMQVSEEEAQKMSDIVINDEIKKAGKLIRRLEKKRGKPFSETQKTALINMSYQLGENVDSEFPTAFKALVEGDIERARQEFMYTKAGSGKHSKWRKQTPNRALRVVESLLQDRPVWEVEQELVEAGLIDPKETAYDKFRNVT